MVKGGNETKEEYQCSFAGARPFLFRFGFASDRWFGLCVSDDGLQQIWLVMHISFSHVFRQFNDLTGVWFAAEFSEPPLFSDLVLRHGEKW
jgi:hypothetical protein